MMVIFLVKYIGFQTETAKTSRIMIFVFILQFFNTGPLVMLINANLFWSRLPLISRLNAGIHPDFTVEWYTDVGRAIINTMIFNIEWPIIEFFAFFFMRLAWRLLDRSICHSSWRTKAKTIQKYVDLYSGPEYFIHYKYSFIMNIVYITFMFGAGMPILFPIALASFIVLYIMESLLLAYSYRQPPMFDESLSKLCIKMLLAAPLLYFTVGFWMFNNIQIFYNEVYLTMSSNDLVNTGHTLMSAFSRMNHSTPLLFILGFFILVRMSRQRHAQLLKKLIYLDLNNFKFKTELVSYFEALSFY